MLFDLDYDDAVETVILLRKPAPEPPALPFPLVRRKPRAPSGPQR